MSELKATPGEWYAGQSVDDKWMVRCESELTMDCMLGLNISGCCDPSEEEANAHLIAAAPELYEALRHLLHNAKASGAEMGLAPMVAEDALAKARGEGDRQ